MDRLRTKFRQLLYRLHKDYLTLNNIILVIALIFCASWAWASVTTMSRNWELEQKLESRQLALEKLKLEIETLKLEKEYYLTAEYQEWAARSKQGKMVDGETMVILPDNSLAAREKYATIDSVAMEEKSNFESWITFLFPELDKQR